MERVKLIVCLLHLIHLIAYLKAAPFWWQPMKISIFKALFALLFLIYYNFIRTIVLLVLGMGESVWGEAVRFSSVDLLLEAFWPFLGFPLVSFY